MKFRDTESVNDIVPNPKITIPTVPSVRTNYQGLYLRTITLPHHRANLTDEIIGVLYRKGAVVFVVG
jgi:hypothetical protein